MFLDWKERVTVGLLHGLWGMSQGFAAFMTHTLDFISILLLFFNPSPLPFTEERTHETNYCTVVQPLESMREYEGATRSRLVRPSMRGYAEGGVPPVMRMSHPPQGCRASDITAALLEEQSNSPTSFLIGWWMTEEGLAAQHFRWLTACSRALRCVVILKGRGRCVCSGVSVCISVTRRVILVAGRRTC